MNKVLPRLASFVILTAIPIAITWVCGPPNKQASELKDTTCSHRSSADECMVVHDQELQNLRYRHTEALELTLQADILRLGGSH